jgi:hypothetical protein
MRGDGVITLLLRAGMMASRLYHRERVIPALTDHLEDKGGVDRHKKDGEGRLNPRHSGGCGTK